MVYECKLCKNCAVLSSVFWNETRDLSSLEILCRLLFFTEKPSYVSLSVYLILNNGTIQQILSPALENLRVKE